MNVRGWIAAAVGAGILVAAGTVLVVTSPWDRSEDPAAFLASDPAAQAAVDAYLDGRQKHLDLKTEDSGNPVSKWESYDTDAIFTSDMPGLTVENAQLSAAPERLERIDEGGFILTEGVYLSWEEVEDNGLRAESGAGDDYILTFAAVEGGYELVSEELVAIPPAHD